MTDQERGSEGAGAPGQESLLGEMAHGALRGVIGAQAMTGMRALTVSLGLVDEPPPRAILTQKSKGPVRLARKKKGRAVQELMHWAYGASGGAVFAALPENVRKKPWFGPFYGVAIWASFEFLQAPLLGLEQAKGVRVLERPALILDHLLFGFVLSELRKRPRD